MVTIDWANNIFVKGDLQRVVCPNKPLGSKFLWVNIPRYSRVQDGIIKANFKRQSMHTE